MFVLLYLATVPFCILSVQLMPTQERYLINKYGINESLSWRMGTSEFNTTFFFFCLVILMTKPCILIVLNVSSKSFDILFHLMLDYFGKKIPLLSLDLNQTCIYHHVNILLFSSLIVLRNILICSSWE